MVHVFRVNSSLHAWQRSTTSENNKWSPTPPCYSCLQFLHYLGNVPVLIWVGFRHLPPSKVKGSFCGPPSLLLLGQGRGMEVNLHACLCRAMTMQIPTTVRQIISYVMQEGRPSSSHYAWKHPSVTYQHLSLNLWTGLHSQ